MSAKKTKRKVRTGDVLVSKIPLRLTGDQRQLVDRLRRESARLWNDILDHHWWLWQTWRIWTNEDELKKWFHAKDYHLHSKQHLILTGKALRSLHRLRNKKLAWFQQRISRTKIGSSRRWTLIGKKRRFLAWIDRKIDYVEHYLSKQAIQWCMDQGIHWLFVGNPDGIQRNTKKKRSRRINQKLSQWSFGELFRKLQYKGGLHGILVERIDESYTTGTCPSCGHYLKQNSRTFWCPKCQATGHRDVIGAVNIRDKVLHGTISKGRSLPTYEETTYRQADLCPHKKAVA